MKMKQLLGATALVGILAGFPTIASAQTTSSTTTTTPPEDDAAKDEKIITVTGSRIARPESSGVLPGVQISGEFIQERGFTSVLEALNDQPLIGPGASPNGTNGAAASGPDAYAGFHRIASGPLGYLAGVGVTWLFLQHMANGIRHLVMDTGAAFEVGASKATATATLIFSFVATIALWALVVFL